MFFDFLKKYIPELLDCIEDEGVELTSEEIKEVADAVDGDEAIWTAIDEAIMEEVRYILRKRKEEK